MSVESLRKERGGRGGERQSPSPSIQQPPHSSPGLKHHYHHYQSEDCGENQLELQSFQPIETSKAKHSLLQVSLSRSEFVSLIWILVLFTVKIFQYTCMYITVAHFCHWVSYQEFLQGVCTIPGKRGHCGLPICLALSPGQPPPKEIHSSRQTHLQSQKKHTTSITVNVR